MYVPDSGARSAQKPDSIKKGNKYYDECRRYCISPLGIYLENVPRSFSVFGFEIAFYGLIIGIGVLAGILMAVHQAKVTGENPDTIWDFAIYAVIFSVIGA